MGLLAKLFGSNGNASEPQLIQPDFPLDKSQPGNMVIEDIFTVVGRGTIVTGKIESGFFYVGQKAAIVSETGEIPIVIASIEQFRKTLAYAGPGENVGILIGNIDRDQIDMGDTLQGIPE